MQQFLTVLILPLGLSLSLMILGLALVAARRHKAGGSLIALAIAWLVVWSLPAISDRLRLSLEIRFDNLPADQLPGADAIIVLGGGMGQVPRHRPYPDLDSSADRVWHAARLYHAGKAGIIIVSGGRFPGREDWLSEAEAMRVFLIDLGVPDEAILLEDDSRNTRENAVFVAQLIGDAGIGEVLLVTSALHMRRALATFAAAGIEAAPAPTDFEVLPRAGIGQWLPDAAALAASTRAFREYLGFWVYRWRGWVDGSAV